jgi:hypothetical protein
VKFFARAPSSCQFQQRIFSVSLTLHERVTKLLFVSICYYLLEVRQTISWGSASRLFSGYSPNDIVSPH